MAHERYQGSRTLAGDQSREVLSAADAKARVFEIWEHLDAVSRKRFAWDENLADTALHFAVGEMEKNGWKRVRQWSGDGSFRSFMTTVLLRLMTDFDRQRLGYRRPPTWLKAQTDPVWLRAYELLVIKKLGKRAVVETLATTAPDRERWFLEQVVATVNGRCRKQVVAGERGLSLDAVREPESAAPDPASVVMDDSNTLLLAAEALLDPSLTMETVADDAVRKLLVRLHSRIKLSAEDRLLLRLRFQDGMAVKSIARLLGHSGDLYKHLAKILTRIRNELSDMGIDLQAG